jgi:hypothetical protein
LISPTIASKPILLFNKLPQPAATSPNMIKLSLALRERAGVGEFNSIHSEVTYDIRSSRFLQVNADGAPLTPAPLPKGEGM